MSEQTPPPGQPTPPPHPASAEGAGPGPVGPHEGGATTPPPPPPGAEQGGAYPPPPPPKKSKKGLLIGLVAGLVVLGLIAAVLVVFVVTRGPDKHAIAIPATAGSLKRDTAKEKELKSQLDAAEQTFKAQAKNVTYVKSGVYQQDKTSRGPVGSLVFLGAKLSKTQSPTAFVSAFSKQAGTNGFKISKISAGDGGGKAVCAEQSAGQKVAICAWATNDSMGELVPTVPGYDSKALSKILVSMRSDIETTE